MNQQRKLKKELKDSYRFEQRFSLATVVRMLSDLHSSDSIIEAATLQVGVVQSRWRRRPRNLRNGRIQPLHP